MALSFPRAGDSIFFPTVHVHDGTVHREAAFDHTLFHQAAAAEASRPSTASKFVKIRKTQGVVGGSPACCPTKTFGSRWPPGGDHRLTAERERSDPGGLPSSWALAWKREVGGLGTSVEAVLTTRSPCLASGYSTASSRLDVDRWCSVDNNIRVRHLKSTIRGAASARFEGTFAPAAASVRSCAFLPSPSF